MQYYEQTLIKQSVQPLSFAVKLHRVINQSKRELSRLDDPKDIDNEAAPTQDGSNDACGCIAECALASKTIFDDTAGAPDSEASVFVMADRASQALAVRPIVLPPLLMELAVVVFRYLDAIGEDVWYSARPLVMICAFYIGQCLGRIAYNKRVNPHEWIPLAFDEMIDVIDHLHFHWLDKLHTWIGPGSLLLLHILKERFFGFRS